LGIDISLGSTQKCWEEASQAALAFFPVSPFNRPISARSIVPAR